MRLLRTGLCVLVLYALLPRPAEAGTAKKLFGWDVRERLAEKGVYSASLFSFSLLLGPSWYLYDENRTTSFAGDVELGLRLPIFANEQVIMGLWPSLGYGFDTEGRSDSSLFVTGVAAGIYGRSLIWGVHAFGRFVAGEVGGATSLGLRSGLRGEFFLGLGALEISHQVHYRSTAEPLHGVRVLVGFDLVQCTRLMIGLFFSRFSRGS